MTTDSPLVKKALSAIDTHAMIPPGSRLLCGVSGGADSVALLHVLNGHRAALGIDALYACHINHGLRGSESDRDEQFVRTICSDWGIPLTVYREDAAAYAAARGLSVEAGARALRYTLFARCCPPDGRIATAHTLTDSIETLIINLARGTGLTGLLGIPPVRGNIIRPLIDCTRAEVEAYLEAAGVDYVIDSTNLTDAYTRNRVRRHILPELAAINPGYEAAAARMIMLLRQDAALLDSRTAELLDSAREGEGYRTHVLAAAPQWLDRAVAALIREAGLSVDYTHISLCADCVRAGRGAVELGGGARFYVHRGLCYIVPQKPTTADDPAAEMTLKRPELLQGARLVRAGGRLWRLSAENYEHSMSNHKISEKDLKNVLDYDKLNEIIRLRPHTAGDRIGRPGQGFHKEIKKLISEARIPPHRRKERVVLLSGEQVVWAEGFGPDATVVVDDQTRRILRIEQIEYAGNCAGRE
jgi:tRNA(Ile)-lysidine synthase